MSIEATPQADFLEGKFPEHAFREIKLLDETTYRLDYKTTITRPVPIPLIVGTNDPKFGQNGHRWIDLFLRFKKLKSFATWEEQINTALDTRLSQGIQLVHIPQTNEYYIYGEGVHRIAFHKVSGNDFVMASVTKCVLKEINEKPASVSEIPMGRSVKILRRLLGWIREWLST